MAAPGPSTSSPASGVQIQRLKPKKPLDVWSTREKLCLASAVFKCGDENWVSVSRAIKPYAEPNRPAEWFHQKNCVLQYYAMMEQLDQPKRKRGGDTESQSMQIMRKMTIERSEQIRKELMEMQQEFKSMQQECEEIEAGQWDDRIQEAWEEIHQEEKAAQELIKTEVKTEEGEEQMAVEGSDSKTYLGDLEDNTQSSIGENVDISVLTDEEVLPQSTSTPLVTAPESMAKLASSSDLLSSLLQSDEKTATGLQQLKQEHEQAQSQGTQLSLLAQGSARSLLVTPVSKDDSLTSTPSIVSLSGSATTTVTTTAAAVSATATSVTSGPSVDSPALSLPCVDEEFETVIEETVIEDVVETVPLADIPSVSSTVEVVPSVGASEDSNTIAEGGIQPDEIELKEEPVEEVIEEESPIQDNDDSAYMNVETPLTGGKDQGEKEPEVKEEAVPPVKRSASEVEGVGLSTTEGVELSEQLVKDEPLSPSSSVSSRMSETGSKRSSRNRGKSRTMRTPRHGPRKSSVADDEKKDDNSLRHSDPELSEDEVRDSSDILSGQVTSVNASSILSESFPNSPASVLGSDTEEEKSFKQWKKSIMLVWRAAATHKYANVFLHPVTNDIAPGYHSVVLRPMDLSTIKKNVETGVIRTTVDFQRDMMLMFTNAIMYNSSDHNVFRMAKEMYDDVMRHLEQYVNTQIIIQTSDGKNLRQSRRPDASDKEEDSKKRRASVEVSETGGKTKKRKTRLDE